MVIIYTDIVPSHTTIWLRVRLCVRGTYSYNIQQDVSAGVLVLHHLTLQCSIFNERVSLTYISLDGVLILCVLLTQLLK